MGGTRSEIPPKKNTPQANEKRNPANSQENRARQGDSHQEDDRRQIAGSDAIDLSFAPLFDRGALLVIHAAISGGGAQVEPPCYHKRLLNLSIALD